MLDIIRREPARVVAVVLAGLGVLAAFGLGITEGQTAAIVALTGAVLALFGGEVTRSQVTPVGKHRRDELGRVDASLIAAIVVALLVAWLLVQAFELLLAR